MKGIYRRTLKIGAYFSPMIFYVIEKSSENKSERWLPIYLVLGVVWGCSFIFIKLGLEFLTPFGVAFGRCALGAVTCYGFSFPYSRRFVLPHKLPPESIAAAQVTAGAITLLPFYLFDGIAEDNYRLGPVLAMLALGIFGSGFAYIWNFKVMALAGSAIASSVTYLTPVVAIVVGLIFLQEQLFWYEPVGAIVVLLGAAIAQERIRINRKLNEQ
jgi:drug/metabolite transporter (DMT)-like permease